MMMMMMILISLSKRNGIIKLDDTSPTRSVGMILVYCGIYLCAGSLAPGHAILSQPLPPARTSESGREAFCPECLVERASECHLRGANQSPVSDPAREQSARHAVHWHTRDVASPSQQPSVVVGVEGFDAEAFAELRRADAELAGVESIDSAHRSHTLVVEHTEASVQVFPEAPALAAVEQNGEDQGDVDLILLLKVLVKGPDC